MIKAKRVTAASGPIQLNTERETDRTVGRAIMIRNEGVTAIVLGGSDVDIDDVSDNGWTLDAGDFISMDLHDGDKVYADGVNLIISVMQVGI